MALGLEAERDAARVLGSTACDSFQPVAEECWRGEGTAPCMLMAKLGKWAGEVVMRKRVVACGGVWLRRLGVGDLLKPAEEGIAYAAGETVVLFGRYHRHGADKKRQRL